MNPLKINFASNSTSLIVTNNRKEKRSGNTSSKIGLKNLDERCMLLIEKSIEVKKDDSRFIVKIPLIKSEV
jgi:sensor histidine kinase YesM